MEIIKICSVCKSKDITLLIKNDKYICKDCFIEKTELEYLKEM